MLKAIVSVMLSMLLGNQHYQQLQCSGLVFSLLFGICITYVNLFSAASPEGSWALPRRMKLQSFSVVVTVLSSSFVMAAIVFTVQLTKMCKSLHFI